MVKADYMDVRKQRSLLKKYLKFKLEEDCKFEILNILWKTVDRYVECSTNK